MSTSWGMGENLVQVLNIFKLRMQFFNRWQHMGRQFMLLLAIAALMMIIPSTTLVVDDPASQPYVVGVGGTSLTVNAATGAYASEAVWNDGLGNGAGGGGVSTVWPIPSWQTNVSTVYSKTHRNVPDVSLNADPDTGYSIYYNGQWTIYGGTSCAAPLWAAFTARVNQAARGHSKAGIRLCESLTLCDWDSDHRRQRIFTILHRATIYIILLVRVMIMLRDGVLLTVPIYLLA